MSMTTISDDRNEIYVLDDSAIDQVTGGILTALVVAGIVVAIAGVALAFYESGRNEEMQKPCPAPKSAN